MASPLWFLSLISVPGSLLAHREISFTFHFWHKSFILDDVKLAQLVYPTTVLNERMWHFRGQNTLWPLLHIFRGQVPQPPDLRPRRKSQLVALLHRGGRYRFVCTHLWPNSGDGKESLLLGFGFIVRVLFDYRRFGFRSDRFGSHIPGLEFGSVRFYVGSEVCDCPNIVTWLVFLWY